MLQDFGSSLSWHEEADDERRESRRNGETLLVARVGDTRAPPRDHVALLEVGCIRSASATDAPADQSLGPMATPMTAENGPDEAIQAELEEELRQAEQEPQREAARRPGGVCGLSRHVRPMRSLASGELPRLGDYETF